MAWHKDCVEVSAGLIWMSLCHVAGENNLNSNTTPPASACEILRVHIGVFNGEKGTEVALFLCGSFGVWHSHIFITYSA